MHFKLRSRAISVRLYLLMINWSNYTW